MQPRHIHTRLNRRYLQLEVGFWAALILSSIAWTGRADGDTVRTAVSWLWTGLSLGIWWLQHKAEKLLDEIEEAE